MALDVNKIRKTQVSTTPTTHNTDAGSTAVSSKPIDLTNSNVQNTDNNTEIVNYINSQEFKNLPPEQQIKQLKERFFPNATTEQIQQYVTEAKQAAMQTAEVGVVQENITPAESADVQKIETTSAQKSDNSQTALESAIEQSGLKGNIDEVKAQLLLLEKNGTITEEQMNILKELRSNEQQNISKQQSSSTESQLLIPMKTLFSEEFRNMTNEEKLDMLTNAYLSKNEDGYSKMSKEEQQLHIQEHKQELVNMLNYDNKKLSEREEKALFAKSMILLQTADKKGISIEDLNKLSPEQIETIVSDGEKAIMKDLVNMIPADKLEGKNLEEQMGTYVDFVLSATDEKYQTLDGPEKEKYAKNKIDDFIMKDLGFSEWKYCNSKQKSNILKCAFVTVKSLANDGKPLSDFKNLEPSVQTEYIIKQLKSNNDTDTKLLSKLNTLLTLQREFERAGIDKPTQGDEYNVLCRLEKENKLTPELRKRLKTIRVDIELKRFNPDARFKMESNNVRAKRINAQVNDMFNSGLKDLKPDNIKEYQQTIDNFIAGADDTAQLRLLSKILKQKGVMTDDLKAKIAKRYNDFGSVGYAEGNGKLVAASMDGVMSIGDKAEINICAKGVGLSAKYLKGEELITVGETAIQHEPLMKPFTESINNRAYITKEDAAYVSTGILNSDNVPNANKATFTKEFITSAAKNGPEEQLYFGKELSKIDNSAVTEGLAAASNSVDSGVRNQYNSYVEAAAKNYPPQQQEAIKSAMQTGEISKETLSQNTVSSSANENSKTIQNLDTTETKASSASKTSAPNNNNRTNSTFSPAEAVSENKVSASKNNNVRTSPSQTVQTEEFQALQEKKEALMEKIVSYETAKAERIIQKETEKEKAIESGVDSASNIHAEDKSEFVDIDLNSSDNTVKPEEELTLTEDEQDVLRAVITDIFRQNSVSAAYDKLLNTLGESGKDKFIEVFASKGKDADIISFAQNNKGNPDTIIKLINYTNSDSLKLELIRLLPSNQIKVLIPKLALKDIAKLVRENKIEPEDFLDYIKNNLGAMSPQQIKEYFKDMPLAYRGELMALLRSIPGSDEWLAARQQNMKTGTTSEPVLADNNDLNEIPTLNDGLPVGSSKKPMRGQYKMKINGPFYMKA